MGVEAAVAVPSSVLSDEVERGGKYLTFRLGAEEYGVEILKVREIIGLLAITAVPRTPDFVRGVVNLRGKIIPVLDLRMKFGMGQVDDTEFTCIVVVDAEVNGRAAHIGVIVDTVSEVVQIADAEIEETPYFGEALDTGFILGMAKHRSGVKILLNIEAVLAESGVVEVATMAAQELARVSESEEKEA